MSSNTARVDEANYGRSRKIGGKGGKGGKVHLASIRSVIREVAVASGVKNSERSLRSANSKKRGKNHRLQKPSRAGSSDNPGILDAVCDQHGNQWTRYGTRGKSVWFATADLISEAPKVFRRLTTVGVTLLTPKAQHELKREIEEHKTFRKALVASQPGWLKNVFVHGDGTWTTRGSDKREIIVTFDPHPKFTPSGSLDDWREGIAPFARNQPLIYFILAYSLIGPLLRFAPQGYLNPQLELVGPAESGKTSLGLLAAATWAGNPQLSCGGGETWDMTINSIDPLQITHSDILLFLDEGNLAGVSAKDRQEFAQKSAFKLSTSAMKRRMGDPVQGVNVRLAMISTTNTALADLVQGKREVTEALRSRRISIQVTQSGPHRVFRSIPDGYCSEKDAVEAMAALTSRYWGTAGRAFVERLVQATRQEKNIEELVSKKISQYLREGQTNASFARIGKTFALTVAAAGLARKWKIFPKEWGSPQSMIQAVAETLPQKYVSSQPNALSAIRSYVEQHHGNIVDVAGLNEPLSKKKFEKSHGFLFRDLAGEFLIVPAKAFQAAFPEHKSMLKELRADQRAKTEGGSKPKLTIKTPKKICKEGRVYQIRIS